MSRHDNQEEGGGHCSNVYFHFEILQVHFFGKFTFWASSLFGSLSSNVFFSNFSKIFTGTPLCLEVNKIKFDKNINYKQIVPNNKLGPDLSMWPTLFREHQFSCSSSSTPRGRKRLCVTLT